MSEFSVFRAGPAVAMVACLVALPLTGCEFLGFGDDEVTIVERDNDGSNQENDANQSEDPEGTRMVFDDDVTLVDDYSDYVEFEVPENTYSIAVSITETDGLNNYLVTDWTAPDGFQIVPADWEENDGQVCYPDCNNRVMMSPGAFGGIMPNNPDALPGVQPGTHQLKVASQNPTAGMFMTNPRTLQTSIDVRLTIQAKVAVEEIPEQGTLDLNLFFTGANDWTAEDAENNAEIQNTIDEIDTTYDQINVDIGEVAYHDVDEEYQIIEDLFSANGDLGEMFSEAERAELNGPSVFMVSELQSPYGGGGGSVLGISGGIPGPTIVAGSPRSGVAIAVDSSTGFGAPGVASVTAHEVGHYMGLFHTSEQMGGFGGMPSHDPLPDTEEDDQSYLMHATGHGDEMSEWQGRVMRNTPWVYQQEEE